jgi:hypothetical protein
MMLAHVFWLTISKRTNDSNLLYHYGLIWDVASTASGYLIPVIFYGVRLQPASIVGFLFVVVGLKLIGS